MCCWATCCLAEKHYDDALAAFSKAIALKPTDASAYLNRGATYAFLKQDDAAEADFQKAIRSIRTPCRLTRIWPASIMYKKDAKKAEDDLSPGDREQSRLAGALPAPGWFDDAGRPQGRCAKRWSSSCAPNSPPSADVASAIGDFYMAARNPDAALKEYQRGLTFDPKNQQLQVRVLETMLNTGKIDDATRS